MEKKIGRNGSEDRRDRCRGRRHLDGPRRCEEIDRGSAVMAEREADRAIVVGQSRSFVAGGRQGGWRPPRGERKRVVVPGEQHRLEEHRKNAKKCGPAARPQQPRPIRPNPCGEARMHVAAIPHGIVRSNPDDTL
jgi:hypothetical protein